MATTGLVMGYFDGNSVTALWNYAQYYVFVAPNVLSDGIVICTSTSR